MPERPVYDREIPRNIGIYPVRTVAQLTGVSKRRIRAWEEQYHLLQPDRTEGGHRLYIENDIERISYIKKRVDMGLSLKGIQRLLENDENREDLRRSL